MKISDVLKSEENIKKFFDIMYREFINDNIPNHFYKNFLMSLNNQKVFIRWMLLNCTELTEYSIFSYDFDTTDNFMSLDRKTRIITDNFMSLDRKTRIILINNLTTGLDYNTLLKKMYEKYEYLMSF